MKTAKLNASPYPISINIYCIPTMCPRLVDVLKIQKSVSCSFSLENVHVTQARVHGGLWRSAFIKDVRREPNLGICV